jgi:hypothetical protein
LAAAFYALTLAVAAGTILALWHMRAIEGAPRPPLAAGIAHGLAGAVGLLLLIPALLGPPRGAAAGAASFGMIAGVLFAAALLSGVVLLLRGRAASVTMAIHAGIAITGYVVLVAWFAVS